MHLHFGRPARPDPETAPQPEPEPRVGLEPPIGLEPQVDVALAFAMTPDGEPGDAVQPIDEGAAPDAPADDAAQSTGAVDPSGADGASDVAPTREAAHGMPMDGTAGDEAHDDPPAAEVGADAWPEMDPIAAADPPTPVRSSGRNGDPAPVGLTAPTPPSGWTDPMTSADGPHYWDRLISSERDRIRRYHRPATVVFIELANLDRLGALWGDDVAAQALIRVGRTLMRQIRSSDHAARIAMGRFAVFLPETNEIAAINFVERVRASIDASLGFMDETLQVGIGWASPADGDIDAALTIAERRLDTDLGRD
jgi:diguanylate cyclase (GGDEF)-like protein